MNESVDEFNDLKWIVTEEMKRASAGVSESLDICRTMDVLDFNPVRNLAAVQDALILKQEDRSPLYRVSTAFLILIWEATQTMKVSLQNALGFRYSIATLLLRIVLENMIRGAFFDSIAKEQFRNEYNIKDQKLRIGHDGDEKVGFLDVLKREIKSEPALVRHLEQGSAIIFDITNKYQIHQRHYRLIPRVSEMVTQLDNWGFTNPIPINELRSIYGHLSKSVHSVPSETDLGRGMLHGRNLFEKPALMENELRRYLALLSKVVDIGMVLSFNILGQHLQQDNLKRATLALTADYEMVLFDYSWFVNLIDSHL